MSKHTPGPWKKGERVPERHAIRILGKNGLLVAEARGAGGPWKEVEANARLIVAAPDLLTALRLCLPFVKGLAVEEISTAAIRKAELQDEGPDPRD